MNNSEAMKKAVDVELSRLGVNDGNSWITKSDGKRFCVAYAPSDAPWFSLPKSKWSSALTALRAIDEKTFPADDPRRMMRIDNAVGEIWDGATAGPEWDGR